MRLDSNSIRVTAPKHRSFGDDVFSAKELPSDAMIGRNEAERQPCNLTSTFERQIGQRIESDLQALASKTTYSWDRAEVQNSAGLPLDSALTGSFDGASILDLGRPDHRYLAFSGDPFEPKYGELSEDGTSIDDYWPLTWNPEPFVGFPAPSLTESGLGLSFGYYDTLAALDMSAPLAASGQFLARLKDAQAELSAFMRRISSLLNASPTPSVFRGVRSGLAVPDISTEDAFRYFDRGLESSDGALYSFEVLNYVLRGELKQWELRRFCEKAQFLFVWISRGVECVEKMLLLATSRFCGLSWTRRVWFLLHGSHPPRTESWRIASQLSGCGRA